MTEARRQQLHFGERLIAEEVADLREDWMKHADQVPEDEQLVSAVYGSARPEEPHTRAKRRTG